MAFQAVNLTPRIATEIKAERATLLGGEHGAEFRDLLEQRGVLVFKNVHFTEDEQRQFSETMGTLMPQLGKKVISISLDPKVNGIMADYQRGAFYWHFDTAQDEIPTRASLLTPMKLSPWGGDTEFANTYAAWDDLPEDEKKTYEKLRVVHALEASQAFFRPEPTVAQLQAWRDLKSAKTHPLVWTHRSGRKSLLIGATAYYVHGMSFEDSRMLLVKLREWATQLQFVYQHKWDMGDLVMWDNTGTIHRATEYPLDCGRRMMRTALMGEEAVA
jgi:alpha-ketoglutarate-dependent taurine dioxygenase